MSGKHARKPAKTSKPSGTSYTGPVAIAVVVAALLFGGGFGAVKLNQERSAERTGAVDPIATQPHRISEPAGTTSPTVSPTASPEGRGILAPRPTPTATPSRKSEPASRGSTRTPRPTTTTSKPKAESVVGTGSCGASYYDEGQLTANGETFNPEALTAAHKTWAFDTRVRVTNPSNGKSVVVRINDRGPFVAGRCIDLSRAAFRAIADLGLGEITVKYAVLDG